MGDVLVEVYDHPETLIGSNPSDAAVVQRRIAACVTDDSGQFFLHVPSGYYEVRFSSADPIGIECKSVLVRVRKLSSRGWFRVTMQLAH